MRALDRFAAVRDGAVGERGAGDGSGGEQGCADQCRQFHVVLPQNEKLIETLALRPGRVKAEVIVEVAERPRTSCQ